MFRDDLNSKVMSHKKHHAIKSLNACFGDMLDDNFVKWLSSKLNYRPGRLLPLLRNNSEEYAWTPRNSVNTEISIQVYNFLKNKTIVSVDRRNGRNKMKVSKIEYLHANSWCTDIDYDNIQEEIKTKNKIKTYITASFYLTFLKEM